MGQDHPQKAAKKVSITFTKTPPEEKIRMTFFLSQKVINELEMVRLELLNRGMNRRDASYSHLIAQAIGLLREKYSGG